MSTDCGTYNARRRHKRRQETCTTCDELFAAAREARLIECGTPAGFRRHRRRNENPCEPCTTACRENSAAKRRAAGIPLRDETMTTQEVIAEIEFLLKAGEGEHRILTALGYENRYNTLKSRLYRAGRPDLITQIFNAWELAA